MSDYKRSEGLSAESLTSKLCSWHTESVAFFDHTSQVTELVGDYDTVLNHCLALTTVSRDHLSMTVSYHFAPCEGNQEFSCGF